MKQITVDDFINFLRTDMGHYDFQADSNLTDLMQLDSLDHAEMSLGIEEHYDICFGDEELSKYHTPTEWTTRINELLAESTKEAVNGTQS